MAELVSGRGWTIGKFSRLAGPVRDYTLVVALVAAAVLIRLGLGRISSEIPPFLTLFPAVFLATLWAGRNAGIVAVILSVVAAAYFWLPPRNDFWISGSGQLNAALFVIVGFLTVIAAQRLRRAEGERHRLATRLLSAQQTSLDSFAIVEAVRDRQNRIVDFVVSYINNTAAALFDQPSEKLRGVRISHLLPGVFARPELLEGLTRVIETGQAAYHEGRYEDERRRGWYRVSLVKLEDGAAVRLRDVTEAVERQQALDDSRERLRAALDAAAIGTWRREPGAAFALWDGSLSRLFGLPAEPRTMTMPEILAFVHPADRALFEKKGRLDDSVSMGHFEFRIVRPDGQVRVLHNSGRFLRDREGRWLATGACVDVTEQRRDSEALRDRELRLALTVEGAGLGMADFDVAAGRGFWSERFCDIVGVPFSAQGVSNEDWIATVHPDDLPAATAVYREARETGCYNSEYRVVRRDTGEIRYVHALGSVLKNEAGEPVRLVAMLQDVTERRTAERALAERERRLQLATEGTGLGTCEIDLASGRAVWSPRLFEIFQMPPREEGTATLDEWMERVHPADREAARLAFEAAVQGSGPLPLEFRVVAEGQGIRWVECHGVAVNEAAARPARFLGVFLDITARRTAEETRDLLAREVDHRARNLFAIVQAIVRLTKATTLEEYRRAVEARVHVLARTHSFLSDAAWQPTDFADVLRAELEGFGLERITLEGPPLRLRPSVVSSLSLMIHELATNAARYGALSTEEGRLAISWRDDDQAGLRILWRETGGPAPALVGPVRGFGSELIANAVQQLGGTLTKDWPPEGLACVIVLPAERTVQAARERLLRARPAPVRG
jgi:PAS domain S-box-containing protein